MFGSTTKQSLGLWPLVWRCVVALSVGLCATASAQAATHYCKRGVFELDNGYTLENWRSSAWMGRQACTRLEGANSFTVLWDIPHYGFINSFGRYRLNRHVDSSDVGAQALHEHTLTNQGKEGSAYTGLYGWFYAPNIEWYIIENWFGAKPKPEGEFRGSFTLDGGIYDVWLVPSNAEREWAQWWSIRRTPQTAGSISYVKHWKKWRSLSMPNATASNVRFFLEPAWGSASKGELTYREALISKP